ncbi:MAG: CRISPR-associated endonuclease Cas1 [Propionicimonas sp.]|uniref:CRISPR-associated endonuclease Cas1 n=1 Tax=Propionicimonas sp. TaxID=1955623 RepID=UPI003D09FBE0
MSEYLLRTLFVHTPGTRLVLDGDAVRALREDAPTKRLPLLSIDSIVVTAGVDVSNPLLLRCADDGRLVAFLSRFGRPRAVVEGPFDGRGRLRRQQYGLHADPGARDRMSGALVSGKIAQMSWALRQWARDMDDGATAGRLRAQATALAGHREKADSLLSRGQLLGIEGVASRSYFEGMGWALRDRTWSGRRRRPTTDPVNAALSFLYGMARIAVHGGIHVAGLDPYCGFLHGDADAQPSLVLDLMEEFRPGVDRLVVGLFNKRQLRDEHFESDALGAVTLSKAGREVVMDAWHAHRMSNVEVSGIVESVPRAVLPLVQANAMANAIRYGSPYAAHRLVVS